MHLSTSQKSATTSPTIFQYNLNKTMGFWFMCLWACVSFGLKNSYDNNYNFSFSSVLFPSDELMKSMRMVT